MMQGRYRQPKNEDAFEEFCLELLREHWALPTLERYGHRGERQDGVDLFDTGGSKPFRGVQCKHHAPHKTITPSELQDEVDKAKAFPEKLDEFYVLTTAKKSARAQRKVREINTEHLTNSLFAVFLLTWDHVERIIDNCPSAQAFLGVQAPEATRRLLRQELRPLHDNLRRQTNDLADEELDRVKSHLDAGEVEIAKFQLQKLRTRSWDQLSPRARWRWCTLRADAELRRGNNHEAAQLLLEAKGYQPDDEKAIVNEVGAYFLLNQRERAFSIAESASRAAPQSVPLYAAMIRVAATDEAACRLLSECPEAMQASPEIWVSAAVRTDNLATATAEPIARKAAYLAPLDARSWFACGRVLLRAELEKTDPQSPPAASGLVKGRLEEARDCFSKTLDLDKGGDPAFLGATLLGRATAHAHLGAQREAHRDVDEARRVAPSQPEVLLGVAKMEEELGREDAAVDVLRQLVMRQQDDEARFFLAMSLWNRNKLDDRAEAVQLLESIRLAGFPHRETAVVAITEGLIIQKRMDDARVRLREAELALESCMSATLMARVEAAAGNQRESELYATRALTSISPTSSKATLRKLVPLLLTAGRLLDAANVQERLAVGGGVDDISQLVATLGQLGRHERILELCAKARAQGVFDSYLIGWEAGLLDRYDPDAALALLHSYLPHDASPERTRLHIAHLSLRLGRLDLAENQLEHLPAVTEASAEHGAAVVAVLIGLGRQLEALEYSYDLLRRHFGEAHAHRAFRNAVMCQQDGPPPTPSAVETGVAVKLDEQGFPAQWYVIEDSRVPAGPVPDELAPTSALATRMVGKRVGESVALSEGVGLARTATIVEMLPKISYRFQDVMNRWQYRFPDLQEMWMVRIAEPEQTGKSAFQPLLDMLNEQRKRSANIEQYYLDNNIPIKAFAAMFRKSELHAMVHLASSETLMVRCCAGNSVEYQQAVDSVKAAVEIVLDVTALATLFLLKRFGILAKIGKRLVVTHSTLSVIRAYASDSEGDERRSGVLGLTTEGPVFHEVSAEERRAYHAYALEFLRAVEEHCAAVGCPALAAVPLEERRELEDVIGSSTLESGVIGARPGTVAWIDDGVGAVYLQQRFGTQRIWTQGLLRWLNEAGVFPDHEYADASMQLLNWRYEFTSANPAVLLAAASASEWNDQRLPLRRALEYLALDCIDAPTAAFLAAKLVADCYLHCALVESRQQLLLAVAERLAKRHNADLTLSRFAAALGPAFGLNVLGREQALRTFAAWQAEFSRRPH